MQLTVPRLDDGVVALRPPTPGDVDAVFRACQDAEISRFTTIPFPYEREHALQFVDEVARGWRDGTGVAFIIVDSEAGELLGSVGLTRFEPAEDVAEVGYWVERDARRRGVASRAVGLVASWVLRDLGIDRLELLADVRNAASQRVAQKAGFRREGEVPAPPRCEERSETMVRFALHADELE